MNNEEILQAIKTLEYNRGDIDDCPDRKLRAFGMAFMCMKKEMRRNWEKEKLVEAVRHFRAGNQDRKAIEECSELIKAICKGYTENIIEETADVMIMCEQLKLIYGAEEVDKVYKKKLERLARRMEEPE